MCAQLRPCSCLLPHARQACVCENEGSTLVACMMHLDGWSFLKRYISNSQAIAAQRARHLRTEFLGSASAIQLQQLQQPCKFTGEHTYTGTHKPPLRCHPAHHHRPLLLLNSQSPSPIGLKSVGPTVGRYISPVPEPFCVKNSALESRVFFFCDEKVDCPCRQARMR